MKPTEIITEFIAKVTASLQDGTFVRLAVTRPAKVLGRLVEIQGQPVLSLTFREATRDVTKNLPVAEVAGWLRAQFTGKTYGALLSTTQQDWQLTPKHLIAHKPAVTVAPVRTHDRQKQTFLDDSTQAWLSALHTTPKKRQQIDRYLEIFSHLAEGMELRTIADMGCGKGYLTFALWHLLRDRPIRIIGVEQRQELVTAGNQLARQIGATGLEFVAGTIESMKLPAVDALIALHACDTATDDAIRRGIAAGAKLIVVAPCCHQQIRPQLGRPEPLAESLRHGMLAERMAEWATDALRVLVLEWAGYRTKVIEFVASEHTPKNLLITAIRERPPFADAAARERIEQFKKFYGITHHGLDELGRD